MKKLGKSQWIIVGCTATIILALFVVVYVLITSNLGNRSGDTNIGQTDTSKTQSTEENNRTKSNYQSPAEALNDLVDIESEFQRTASLYTYLADIDTNDLLDLLRRSENIKRNNVRSNIQNVALRKLALIDLNEALRWIANIPRVRRAPMLESVFYEWSLTNLSDAVEGAKTLDGIDRRTALEAILFTRNDFSKSVMLEIARELDLEEIAHIQISSTQALELLDDPSSAWDFVVNDNVDDTSQLELLKLVFSEWKEEAGFDVMLHAAALFPNKDERRALSTVIEGAVGTQLNEAFDYLKQLPRKERGELPCALALAAARIHPMLALLEIEKWSDEPIHVQMQKGAATTWAHTDPSELLNNLELLPQVTRVEALDIAFAQLAYAAPEEAIQYIDEAKKYLRSETRVLAIIAKQWSNVNPEAALEWAISNSETNSSRRKSLVQRVFKNLALVDTHEALELARGVWSSRISVIDAAEYDVISEFLHVGKIEDAIALLPEIHEQARYFAIVDLGHSLVRAGDPYSAVELGLDVPSLNAPMVGPAGYFTGLFSTWADYDPQQLFDSLPAITSQPLRSKATKILLDHETTRPTLAEESIKSMEEFLNEHPSTGSVDLLELQMRAEKGLIDFDEMDLPEGWFEQ